jgi:bacillithiol system protein YtxJ
MNLFNNIFKSDTQNDSSNRIVLTEADQIEDIINSSEEKPVLIFKHSTRCGISTMILKRFENKISTHTTPYYLLDIIKHRPLSNLIQDKFGVRHQSPQLLVIKNGKVVAHDSHYGVLDVNF